MEMERLTFGNGLSTPAAPYTANDKMNIIV